MTDVVIYSLIAAFFIAVGVVLISKDVDRWEAFKTQHECKKTAYISGDVFTTVGPTSSGGISVGIGSTPDKTGWLCNDGITYYR